MADPVDVLLLAAHPLELAPFAQAWGPALRAEIGGLRVAAASVGVGVFAAGAGAARAIMLERPRKALLVGSYGLYPGRGAFESLRLLIPSRICAVDGATLAGRAAMPDVMRVAVEPARGLAEALAQRAPEAARGTLATTAAITIDDALAAELARASGCDAENLEAIAVALACEDQAIPFAAVLACTNEVGSRGRAQWMQWKDGAAAATSRLVLGWLADGAPQL